MKRYAHVGSHPEYMKIYNLFVTVILQTAIVACDKPQTILLQKFDADGYSLTIEGNKESTRKSLRVRKDERTSIVQLREHPVEIKKVGEDSFLVEYFEFSSPQQTTEYKSLDEGFVLVEHFNRVVGYITEKRIQRRQSQKQ